MSTRITKYAIYSLLGTCILCSCMTAKAYFPNENNLPEYKFNITRKHFWDKDEFSIMNTQFKVLSDIKKIDNSGTGYYKKNLEYNVDGINKATVNIIVTKTTTNLLVFSVTSDNRFIQIDIINKQINLDLNEDRYFDNHYLSSGSLIHYEKNKQSLQGGKIYNLWGGSISGYSIYINNKFIGMMNLMSYPSIFIDKSYLNKLNEEEQNLLLIEVMCIFIENRASER